MISKGTKKTIACLCVLISSCSVNQQVDLSEFEVDNFPNHDLPTVDDYCGNVNDLLIEKRKIINNVRSQVGDLNPKEETKSLIIIANQVSEDTLKALAKIFTDCRAEYNKWLLEAKNDSKRLELKSQIARNQANVIDVFNKWRIAMSTYQNNDIAKIMRESGISDLRTELKSFIIHHNANYNYLNKKHLIETWALSLLILDLRNNIANMYSKFSNEIDLSKKDIAFLKNTNDDLKNKLSIANTTIDDLNLLNRELALKLKEESTKIASNKSMANLAIDNIKILEEKNEGLYKSLSSSAMNNGVKIATIIDRGGDYVECSNNKSVLDRLVDSFTSDRCLSEEK